VKDSSRSFSLKFLKQTISIIMKLLILLFILLSPMVLLIIGCICLQVAWPYYLIAWLAGSGIGTLALFTWFQVKSVQSNTTVKIHHKNKKS